MPSKPAALKTPPHPLVGKTFLSYQLNSSGRRYIVHWVGSIEAVVPSNSPVGDLALLQLHERFQGTNSNCYLIPVATLAAPPNTGDHWFRIFNSDEERTRYHESWKRRYMEACGSS